MKKLKFDPQILSWINKKKLSPRDQKLDQQIKSLIKRSGVNLDEIMMQYRCKLGNTLMQFR